MRRLMLKSKIHKARTTESNLDYEGSLSLDEDLMNAADMLPHEQIQVYNISNGERFTTYIIKGEAGSGLVGVNGAAAHKASVGDELIITSYAVMKEEEIEFFTPKIIICDENNKIK